MKAWAIGAIWTMVAACASPEDLGDASTRGDGSGGAGECALGAVQACEPCALGPIRTNLPGVRTCRAADGGAAWGPCRCTAEGGAP